MLSNAYFLAKFRFDTAENEPAKNLQNFRKMHFRKMLFEKGGVEDRQKLPRTLEARAEQKKAELEREKKPRAPVGDTTADRQNFGKMLLVFGCIGSDFCK